MKSETNITAEKLADYRARDEACDSDAVAQSLSATELADRLEDMSRMFGRLHSNAATLREAANRLRRKA